MVAGRPPPVDSLTHWPAPYSPGHCVDLPDTGLCLENIPRWYYNPFSERCARFTYGGCYGNKNNFEEEQQCLASCRGISSELGSGAQRLGKGKALCSGPSSSEYLEWQWNRVAEGGLGALRSSHLRAFSILLFLSS